MIPAGLAAYALALSEDGSELIYTYETQGEPTGIAQMLRELAANGIDFRSLQSSESSLEEIFVDILRTEA